MNSIGPFGKTILELTLTDKDSFDCQLCKLVGDNFINALKLFSNLICYSNVCWDTLVNYTTGNIRTGGFDHKVIEKENENKKLPFILKDELKSSEYTLQPLESFMFHKLNEIPWQRFAVFPARPLFAHTDVFFNF